MKKVISFLLVLTIVLTSLNMIIFSSEALITDAMSPGKADTITILDNPIHALGDGTSGDVCIVANGSFEGAFAKVNENVAASKVFTTWRWFLWNSSFYSHISAGNYVYCPNPNNNEGIPEIVYSISGNSVLKFSLGLRADTAEWSDFKIEYSKNGDEYSAVKASDVVYTTENFQADAAYCQGEKSGQPHTVAVRSYDVFVEETGFVKITLPKAKTIKTNTIEKGLNTADYAFIGSSAFLIPATVTEVDADRLKPGDDDIISVNTSSSPLCGDKGKLAYSKADVTSLATLNEGASAVLVDSDWHWSNNPNFYLEVVPVDSWVYSINPWNSTVTPTVTYKVTGGTRVDFKVVLRDGAASFEDVEISYSVDGDAFETVSKNKLNYSENVYSADISKLRVRNYQVYIPKDNGLLRITLPKASTVMDAIVGNSLNPDRESVVYSSAMVIPASCEYSNKVLTAGKSDEITVSSNSTVIAGGFADDSLCAVGASDIGTEYARVNGGIAATKVFSTWRWFRGNSEFYNDVIPASTPEKTSWLYSVNPSYLDGAPTIQYDVVADTEVSLKIGIRNDTANWNDVKFSFSTDGTFFNNEALNSVYISEKYVCEDVMYSGGKKSGTFHEIEVREYIVSIPEDGILKIEFPTGVDVANNILNNNLNPSSYSVVFSSVFMLPATCYKAGTSTGAFTREYQYVVSVGKKLITISDSIALKDISNYIEFKNMPKEKYTFQYLDEKGKPLVDENAIIPAGCNLNIIDSKGEIVKKYIIERSYNEKRLMTIGTSDSLSLSNAPHYYDADGKMVITSAYLQNSGLEYATVSGAVLLKQTDSWVFSPFFTLGADDKVWSTVYAMGEASKITGERVSIAWRVAERSEFQIPIMLPADCSSFYNEFEFLISSDGEHYEKVPAHLIEYRQTTRNYNNWGDAYTRFYSIHMVEEGYIKVVFPEFSRTQEEISKINSGINFIESVVCIAPPTVVKSSKDSSVSVGEKSENINITIDEINKKIEAVGLNKANLTVGDLVNSLALNYCYGKVIDANGKEVPYSTKLSDSFKLSVYTRGNVFTQDDTHFTDYDVKVTMIEKFFKPEISAKDQTVIINYNDNTVNVSFTIYDTINYETLLSRLNFSHCTYKLTTVGNVPFTDTMSNVGSSPVFIKLYTKDCPGIEDGTYYDSYEILGEILKADRVFKSRDTSVLYIDEGTKTIYYKNDITIGQMKKGLIMINTSISFFDAEENELYEDNIILKENMFISTTYGSTELYYTLQPMTVVIKPASKQTVTTKNYRIIEGYDSDIKLVITVSIIAGACLLVLIATIVVLIVVKRRKRKGMR